MANRSYDVFEVELQGEVANTMPSFKGEGIKRTVRMLRDGSITTADFITAMTLAGFGRLASVGTVTTPITFAAYDADQPQVAIGVPSGRTIMPINIAVYLEDSAGTDTEFLFVTSDATVSAGTSTAITPANLINGASKGDGAGQCTIYSAYSGNGTVPTNTVEFWRDGYAFADTTLGPIKSYRWDVRSQAPVFVVGVGSVVGYVSATGTQAAGFLKAAYLEFPTAYLL